MPTQGAYKFLSSNSNFVILTRGAEFGRELLLTVYDEYDNIIPFGYDENGNVLDNQIRLHFICHD
jgi:hypothetical protein